MRCLAACRTTELRIGSFCNEAGFAMSACFVPRQFTAVFPAGNLGDVGTPIAANSSGWTAGQEGFLAYATNDGVCRFNTVEPATFLNGDFSCHNHSSESFGLTMNVLDGGRPFLRGYSASVAWWGSMMYPWSISTSNPGSASATVL